MYRGVFLLSLFVYLAAAKHEHYNGYAVYQVTVATEEQAQNFNSLEYQGFDIWNYAAPSRPGVILVPGPKRAEFQNAMITLGLPYEVQTENVKELLDEEDRLLAAAAKRSTRTPGRISFDRIYRYDEVNAYLDEIAATYSNVTLVSAGHSYDGREIKYLKISTTDFKDTSKPVIMLQGMLHAREWITLPAALYAIEKLVVNITDGDLVDKIDWIIIPLINPDGYEFSHTNYRFWRKNRSAQKYNDICFGVDLNRNFDINWGQHSDANGCGDVFHGDAPFSEIESSITRDIVHEHLNRLELFIDIHSYGSLILYGYGTGQLPANALTLNVVAVRMAASIDAVKWESKPNYRVGNSAMVLYLNSGVCPDYVQAVGVPLAYTFELPGYRNMGSFTGFLVDPDFIEQAGFETWEGIKSGARFVLDNY